VARRSFEPKEFEESVISIDRVTKVVKGGKKMKFRVLVVVGNKKGKVGIGIGKAVEIPLAITKGVTAAKRNLVTFTLKGTTTAILDKDPHGRGLGLSSAGCYRNGDSCWRRRSPNHGESRSSGCAHEISWQLEYHFSCYCHNRRAS